MINLKNELILITDTLNKLNIDYALCGGMAVIIHGYPRLTRDIDLMVQEEDLVRVREALKKNGYSIEAGIIPFDIGKPTERQIFRITKFEGEDYLTIDLILVAPFLSEIWEEREKHEVEGRCLHVISLNGLIKMKKIAGRPQDIADISFFEQGMDKGNS